MGEWLSGNYLDGCCRLKWGKKFVRIKATINGVGYGSYQHEEPVKLQDRWAEDKGIWVGRSHSYFILIGEQKRGRATNFFEGRTRFVTDWAQETSLTKLVTYRPIKSTSQIPPRARRDTVFRNLKEEAKDEPVSGVGYEIIDFRT